MFVGATAVLMLLQCLVIPGPRLMGSPSLEDIFWIVVEEEPDT